MPMTSEPTSRSTLANSDEFRQRLPLQWVVAALPDSYLKIVSQLMPIMFQSQKMNSHSLSGRA